MTLSRESERLVEAALKKKNWFWKTTHREAFVTKVKVPLIELKIKDHIKKLREGEREGFLKALRERAAEAEPEARKPLQIALKRIDGAIHQKAVGSLVHREARKQVEEEAKRIIRRVSDREAQALLEHNFSDFVKLLPELHVSRPGDNNYLGDVEYFINDIWKYLKTITWGKLRLLLQVRFSGLDVGGDPHYENLSYRNLYLLAKLDFTVEEYVKALRAISSLNDQREFDVSGGVAIASRTGRNLKEFLLSLNILKRWSDQSHNFWDKPYRTLFSLAYSDIITRPYQLEAALKAFEKYGITYLVQKCAEHRIIRNHADLEKLLRLCHEESWFMKYNEGVDALYAEIESLKIESVRDIRKAVEELKRFEEMSKYSGGGKAALKRLLQRLIAQSIMTPEQALEELESINGVDAELFETHFWLVMIDDIKRHRSLKPLLKGIHEKAVDPRYSSVEGVTEMGFLVCHVANAYTDPEKVRENILGFFDEQNHKWNPSCSVIKPGYLPSLANTGRATEIGGPVGVIFSKGHIYEAHMGDAWTKDVTDENGDTYRTAGRGTTKQGIVIEYSRRAYNEVLLKEWEVSALFVTTDCKEYAMSLLNEIKDKLDNTIRDEPKREVPIYEIDLKTKHWRIIDKGQE